jgi:hypothetical protein
LGSAAEELVEEFNLPAGDRERGGREGEGGGGLKHDSCVIYSTRRIARVEEEQEEEEEEEEEEKGGSHITVACYFSARRLLPLIAHSIRSVIRWALIDSDDIGGSGHYNVKFLTFRRH